MEYGYAVFYKLLVRDQTRHRICVRELLALAGMSFRVPVGEQRKPLGIRMAKPIIPVCFSKLAARTVDTPDGFGVIDAELVRSDSNYLACIRPTAPLVVSTHPSRLLYSVAVTQESLKYHIPDEYQHLSSQNRPGIPSKSTKAV